MAAASVLGKRTRSSNRDETLHSLPTRSARRVRSSPRAKVESLDFVIHQDGIDTSESADSSAPTTTPSQGQRSTALTPSPSKGNVASLRTSPSKHVNSASIREQKSAVPPPRTPRHRDSVPQRKLSTPRHQVSVGSIPFSPRTPRTPASLTKRASNRIPIYSEARRLFSKSTESGLLIGRERERAELESFVMEALHVRHGGCLYVSGPPGTGKSAFVDSVCNEQNMSGVRVAQLNCMSVRSATDIYSHLISALGISDDVFGRQAKDLLENAVCSTKDGLSYLVVLDEVDQLLELDIEALYSLFEWALRPSSRLVLVGIANALDLTDRLLPQLKAQNLKPQLLPFLPYSALEIANIITTRVKTLLPDGSPASSDFTPILTRQAIQLISKKVSAQSGDLRKAFEISQKVINMLEDEQSSQTSQQSIDSPTRAPLGENANLSSPRSPSEGEKNDDMSAQKLLTLETAPRASLSHVLRVTNAAFAANSTNSRLGSLNLQQKAALCSMSALEAQNQRKIQRQQQQQDQEQQALPSPTHTPSAKRVKMSSKVMNRSGANAVLVTAPTIRDVYEAYSALCRTENVLHALSLSEFRDVVNNLETAGLVSGVDGRGSLTQVAPMTPSRRGAGAKGAAMTMRVEDCRIKGTASLEELEGALKGPGSEVLRRMLRGEF